MNEILTNFFLNDLVKQGFSCVLVGSRNYFLTLTSRILSMEYYQTLASEIARGEEHIYEIIGAIKKTLGRNRNEIMLYSAKVFESNRHFRFRDYSKFKEAFSSKVVG